jgi:hypothetical protein
MKGGRRELAAVLFGSAVSTLALVQPIALHVLTAGRIDNGDGQLSIWNVAWVSRTLVTDPLRVFDANIFYPHRWTLSYSESNIGAGLLGIPGYWLSGGNPYAAHNTAVLLSFLLTATGMYYLVRRLTGDRRAAVVSAICFAYTPFLFAHTPHVQLLMTFGLPFSLLAFHRVVESPTIGRGAALGGCMAAQAISCGYYGVFLILIVAFGILLIAAMQRRWSDLRYWLSFAAAALVAVALVLPCFVPYLWLQREGGFTRALDEADRYSANWSTYLASAAAAHAWMLPHLGRWTDVAFPGFVATIGGLAGLWLGRRLRNGEVVALYGGVVVLAFWASFGPRAGLYTVLYRTIPIFSLLRGSVRFSLLVAFGLSVLTGVAVATLLARVRASTLVGCAIAGVAAAELFVPFSMPKADPPAPVYRTLATLPRGPVIAMPFYYPEVGLFQHTKHMLASTAHWMPLVNGYSDYIPPDFYEHVMTLATFPSRAAFKILEPDRVRYALFLMYGYNTENRNDVLGRLKEFERYLRPLYADETTRLYEIVGYPP